MQSYVEPPPCFVYFLKKSYEKDCEIWSAHKNVISIASDVAKQEPWSVVSCDCMLRIEEETVLKVCGNPKSESYDLHCGRSLLFSVHN